MTASKRWNGAWARRAGLLALALALAAGGWLILAPVPANADGDAMTFNSGNWDPQIRPSGESGNACTNTRSYAANGGSNSVVFRTTTHNQACMLSGGRNPASANWPRYEIKVASASGQHGSTSALPGANITYVSGIASGTGSWRNVAGTTYNYRSAGISGALDSGQIGFDGSANDLSATFTVPVTHVGTAYLRFTLTAQPVGIFMTHEHVELAYADPHVAAVPLAVPQSSGGTLVTGDLSTATRTYAASAASQRARVFLRDDWHSNTYTATETNVARSAFDSATIKVASDAAGATVITGAKISSDAAGATAIAACTETSAGNTCTITSANFPQASGMNPRTVPQDIYFSVPGSHTGSAYLVVTTAKSSLTARNFALQYAAPPVQADSPLVRISATDADLCAEDATGPCTTPSIKRGTPAGFITRVLPDPDSGASTVTYADLAPADALKLGATNGTIVHEDLCPHVASHPLDTTPMASSTSCTISRAALMRFQGATSMSAAVKPFEAVYIAGSAASGSAEAVWKIGGTGEQKMITFTHTAASAEFATSAYLDWSAAGRNYATAKPTALFAVGRAASGEVPAAAMPSGLAWFKFEQLAAAKAVELSINQGTISYGQIACESSSAGCTITLSRLQLRDGTAATMDTDLTGNMRVEYVQPLNAGEPTVLTVKAWAAGVSTPVSSNLTLSDSIVSRPVGSATAPGDADGLIAPSQTVGVAAGFTVAVDATGAGWGCAGFGSSFLELTGPQTLVEGCTLARSTENPPGAPAPSSGWLTNDSYLVITGPATFADGGGKRLRLGGTWDRLRCGPARAQGATDAGGRDVACWVTNADGERPRILVDAGAASDIKITTNLEIVEGRTLRLFTGPGAELPLNRYASAAAFDLPSTVFGSGTLKVGSVKELATVRLSRAPQNGIVPTSPVRASTPTQLRLTLLNENGGASRLAAVSSITVTASGGGTLGGPYCATAVSCTIRTASSALAEATGANPSTTAAIALTYTPPAKPGTATVRAAVVGADGTSFTEELELTISGAATDLSVGQAMPRVHSSATANDDRDTINIPVTAQDANGNAARMPLNVIAAVRGPDNAALPAGSHTAEVQCEGGENEARLACNIVVTVTAEAASPLASGQYTASLTGSGIAAVRASFAVAGPANAVTLEIPEALGDLAESFSATARAVDKSGQSVADGTWVEFSTTATQGGSPTAIVTAPPALDHDGSEATPRLRRAATKNGEAAATVTIVGRGVSVLTATAGGKFANQPVDTRGASSPQDQVIEAADHNAAPAAGAPATYRGATAASASELLAMGPDDAVIVWLWNGKTWLRYAEADGQSLPGSVDFSILPDDLIWFGGS